LLVLGVVGSVVGCGSSAPQSSPAQLEEAGKAISEGQRKLHQQLKESAKTGGPDMRQSKFRRKS
jgi:hypothetical protein